MKKGDLVQVKSLSRKKLEAYRPLNEREISEWKETYRNQFDSSGELMLQPKHIIFTPDENKYYVVVKARVGSLHKTGFCELCETDTGTNFFIHKSLVSPVVERE